MDIEEKQFVEKLKEGDQTCFTFLFNRYYSGLVVYANHLLDSTENSEDIVHDVFMAVWDKRSVLPVTVSIKHYLFTAVRNRCLNQLTHLQIRNDYQKSVLRKGDLSEGLTWEYYVETELSAMIDSAISKLPPQCQRVFMMSRFEDKTAAEIAAELEISPRTVEKHIEKAIRFLRVELQEYLPVGLLLWILKA